MIQLRPENNRSYPEVRDGFTVDASMNLTDAHFDFGREKIKKTLMDTADFGFLLALATRLVL